MGVPEISKDSTSSYRYSLISLGNVDPLGFISLSFLFIKSTILWHFFLLFAITSFDLICFWDVMCLLTEIFFLHTVSLQASHLSLPDITIRCSPLNRFNVSQALTFGSAVPRTFRFFLAGFVCTLRFLKMTLFLWSTQPCSWFCCYPQKDLQDLLIEL